MSYPLSAIDTVTPDVGLATGAAKINAAVALLNNPYPRFRQQLSSHTLQLSDLGYVIWLRGTDPITITIPATSSVAWPVGAQIVLQGIDTGTYTLAAGAGVSLNLVGGGSCTLNRWTRQVLQRGSGEGWVISGNHGTIT